MVDALALIVVGAFILILAVLVKNNQGNKQARAISHSPTQALTTGDVWYKQALNMARLLERMKADPMLSGTWDTKTESDIAKVLNKFWEDNEIE